MSTSWGTSPGGVPRSPVDERAAPAPHSPHQAAELPRPKKPWAPWLRLQGGSLGQGPSGCVWGVGSGGVGVGMARPGAGGGAGDPPGGEEEAAQPGTSPGGSCSGFSPGVAGGIKGTWSRAASRSAASRSAASRPAASRPVARCTCLSEPSAPAAMVSLVSRCLSPRPRLPRAAGSQAEEVGTGFRKPPKSGDRREPGPRSSGALGSLG